MAEHVGVVLTSLEVSTRYDDDASSGLFALFLSLFLLHALSAIYIHLLISLVFSCGFVAVFRFELFLWSSGQEFLATDTEVPGSIPGATRFSE